MRSMKLITSAQNEQLKHLFRLLTQAKARRESGETVLEGVHLLQTYLQSGGTPKQVYLPEKKQQHPEIQVFLTADDPNYEDPMTIAEEISSYISHPVEKIVDREQAIKAAMAITNQELDAVIIAGKGADCYQIINGVKESYPGDSAVAERYL